MKRIPIRLITSFVDDKKLFSFKILNRENTGVEDKIICVNPPYTFNVISSILVDFIKTLLGLELKFSPKHTFYVLFFQVSLCVVSFRFFDFLRTTMTTIRMMITIIIDKSASNSNGSIPAIVGRLSSYVKYTFFELSNEKELSKCSV